MSAEPWRYVLIGDGLSPHLLKWARTIHTLLGASVALHVVSTRGLLPEFEAFIEPPRCLVLNTQPQAAGGNIGVLRHAPRVARWLKAIAPHVVHAHYLTSHGTLAWLARSVWGVPGVLVGSAWGSDILLSPQRSPWIRALTQRVLRSCDLTTSDSEHMAGFMRQWGAREVMVFPFGLESLPDLAVDADPRDADLFFSNRGLEPWYGVDRVLAFFSEVARHRPQARLCVAHTGSLQAALQQQARALGLADRVEFTGRLSAAQQAQIYARCQWYFSLPSSDSVSVSVLEAMAHGAVPILSDLPANRELVRHADNGWIVPDAGVSAMSAAAQDFLAARDRLLARAPEVACSNRDWVLHHGLFPPAVQAFLARLPRMPKGVWVSASPPDPTAP